MSKNSEEYLEKVVFKGKEEIFQELKYINQELKDLEILRKTPFLIEFAGPARSGKSTTISMITDILKKYNVKIEAVDEETVELTKKINNSREKKLNIDSLDYTHKLIEEKINFYDYFSKQDLDIVIFDRGINDEFNWLKTFSETDELLPEYDQKLGERSLDILVIQTSDVTTCMKRKHLNSLSILPNKWTNEETLTKYLDSIKSNSSYFEKHAKNIYIIDTSKEEPIKVAIKVCKEILNQLKQDNI